jgi:hypothetical protein
MKSTYKVAHCCISCEINKSYLKKRKKETKKKTTTMSSFQEKKPIKNMSYQNKYYNSGIEGFSKIY